MLDIGGNIILNVNLMYTHQCNKMCAVSYSVVFILGRQCLGKSGMVKKVGSNNRAMVEIRGKTYAWNVKALRLAAKSGTSVSRMCVCRAPTDHGLFAAPHVRWYWMM